MSSSSKIYSQPQYDWMWEEDVEDVESYRKGGFHPVKLDDELSGGRYRVVHKLGYGSFSTVWLAKDQVANKYVSIKIIAAKATERSSEVQMLNKVYQGNSLHPGRQFIFSLLDDFLLSGSNGNHRCLVSDVYGVTVAGMKESFVYDLLPLQTARRVTAQMALGLSYIHSCGVVHGDFYSKNVAFKLPSLDSWPVEQVYEAFGSPDKHAITRKEGNSLGSAAPPYAVVSAFLKLERSPNDDIAIIDFGAAFTATESQKTCRTPLPFQAPEAQLGEPAGQPADMWAFACTVFELFDNESLFRKSDFDNDSVVLAEIVDALGRLPEQWWAKWKWRAEHYEEDGTKKIEGLTEEYRVVKPLKARIQQIRSSPPAAVEEAEKLSEEDVIGLEQLLRMCLRYDPSERATAEDVLNMDWIRKIQKSLPR
ncbi:MAG: hypothetical protein Q9190_000116 [Brigantiaea leucoxantha]